MTEPSLDARVALLERLTTQQLALNDQLSELTRRLGDEHALYQDRLARDEAILAALAESQRLHEERLAWHEAQMASLAQTLAAIKDMLPRGNGH